MNVGLTTSVIQGGRSGIAQYLFALVRSLFAYTDRHRFTLFVLERDRPLFEFAARRMRIVMVPEFCRTPWRDIVWHQTVLPRLVRRHRIDVLHTPSYRRMVRAAPCARVATIHDLAPFHVPGKYDWMRMMYGRVVARRLAWRQHRIIAVSEATATDLGRYFGVPSNRVAVIPNGLDHDRFRPGDTAGERRWVRENHGLDRSFLLYVARLEHPGKNHVRLIDAFDGFKRATGSDWLLVLGGGDWHGAAAIHERIRRSPWRQDIRCLGFVPDADVARWYRAAEALVFPSLFEGFGLPPLEAMACGCPVICSGRGALAEVTGGAAALIDPEDVEGLQVGMTRLASQPAWRASLRAAGLKRAAEFSWAETAARTVEVYAAAVTALPWRDGR